MEIVILPQLNATSSERNSVSFSANSSSSSSPGVSSAWSNLLGTQSTPRRRSAAHTNESHFEEASTTVGSILDSTGVGSTSSTITSSSTPEETRATSKRRSVGSSTSNSLLSNEPPTKFRRMLSGPRSVADRIKILALNDDNNAIVDGLDESNLKDGILRDGEYLNNSTGKASTSKCELQPDKRIRSKKTTASSLAASKKCVAQSPLCLDETQKNTVRIIGQYLNSLGLKNTADSLVEESGCRIENPLAIHLRNLVKQRSWMRAVEVLEKLRSSLTPDVYNRARILLLEERIKEKFAENDKLGALKLLKREYPNDEAFSQRREFLTTLIFKENDEIADRFRSQNPDETVESVLQYLYKILPSTVLLAPSRLEGLINQAWSYQMDKCGLHLNEPANEPIAKEFILRDHTCSASNFPSRCSQIFHDHRSEVWCLKFSPCGRFLATGAKSSYVYVWRMEDPETMELTFYRRLVPRTEITGIAALSWSYDSQFLAIAACEGNQTGIFMFNIVNGVCMNEIRPNQREAFCTVSFFGNKTYKLACADRFGFFQCHDVTKLESGYKHFTGFRIGCMHSMQDGRTVIASDTLHRIRSYDFENQDDATLITENSSITYFTIDRNEEHCLVTTRTEGLRLWCLKTHTLMRTFFGSIHNDYVISSTFGGVSGDFIASGSEDETIVIWNRRNEKPIHQITGHVGTVNAVSWNPVYHGMLASGGDDSTIRIWLPENSGRFSRIQSISA